MTAALIQDLRYAVRSLRASPGFTAAALATLAISIGANAAIFSVVRGVILKPLPFKDPGRLVAVGEEVAGDLTSVNSTSPGTFYDWRARSDAFESLSAFSTFMATLVGHGEAERVQGTISAGSVLETLGVPAEHGRLLAVADDRFGRPGAIVVSHALATRLFGHAASAVNRSLTLNSQAYNIVGVMPAGFHFPDGDTQFWMSAQFNNGLRYERTEYFLVGLGRLRRTHTTETASAQLNTVMAQIRAEHPGLQDGPVAVRDLRTVFVSSVRVPMLLLMGAVSCVLLVACANLANLLLARATSRSREIAIRQALGAGTGRILRQLCTESVVLAAAGGVLGLLAARWILGVLVAQLPAGTPRVEEIALDAVVATSTIGMSALCGLLFGLSPALFLLGGRPSTALREIGRAADGRLRVRAVLVAAEVAMAMMLLVAAGLLLRSFVALQQVDPGVRTDRLLTFQMSFQGPLYPPARRPAALQRALGAFGRLPGIQGAAAINQLPVTGSGISAWLNIVGRPAPQGRNPDSVVYRVVTPNYFSVAGLKLVRGRWFQDTDTRQQSRAVIIDEALARRYWPNEDPLGRQIILGAVPDNVLFPDARIVGVVSSVRQMGLGADPPGLVYLPHRLVPMWGGFSIMLRTSGDPRTVIADVRSTLREFDPSIALANVRTMDEILAQSVAPTRLPLMLVGVFAALALGLASLGVFGVLSYAVNRRRQEMGIRLTLGAAPRSLRLLVLRDGMIPVAAGIAAGSAGALAVGSVLEGMLFNVRPADPATFVAVGLVLLVFAAAACYLPARRATKVDPLVVLRTE